MNANHSDQPSPPADSPVVDDVRARAMAISARYGHDLRSYAAHLASLQAQNRGRLVSQARIDRADEPPPPRRSKPAA